jgi:hypothetical protein
MKADSYYLLISSQGTGDGSGTVKYPMNTESVCPDPPCRLMAATAVGCDFAVEFFWTADLDKWVQSNKSKLAGLKTFSIVAITNVVT